MRVITGEFKGRKLLSPATNDVRPTTDKVKEAIFSMLIPYLSEGCVVIDLFAGSGGLGIEALSRGAGKCYFSDYSRYSISLVRENIKICGIENRSVLLTGDFRQNLSRIKEKADIILIDPPYADKYILPALTEIKRNGLLNDGGCVVCEHASEDIMPAEFEGLCRVRDKSYGAIGVTLYE